LPPDLEAFWSSLGFLVIQGYGLTETAPIVTLNHPFHARQGSVGKPIGGVEVKIAEDGEILVRGENVTSGYFNSPEETARAFADGWFHTGDIGRLDESGQLAILGRKKEMIVTPEGLNVFPEDVEAVLNQADGVKESAVVGKDRVHAVLILEPGADAEAIVRAANARLADHQKIRDYSLWPYDRFPRTEGTNKLKRREIAAGAQPLKRDTKYDPATPLDTLTSLERVELMVSLDVDESAVQKASTVADLRQLRDSAPPREAEPPAKLPSWNRTAIPRALRRVALPGFLLPLARHYVRLRVEGLERLKDVEPPVIFAANHQSYLDVPAILSALPPRWRSRVAPAMRKEFFDAHFHPERHPLGERFTNSLNYYLAAGLFNAFPLPQREAGTLETLRYMGELVSDGWCVLIFPEGRMTDDGSLSPFRPGVGMLASRLNVPVMPVRLTGLDRVLRHTWRRAKPGPVKIAFGSPITLNGHDYAALAKRVEDAVRTL
ncbi:MAG: 1-acyl-sn-glycerol-3-phosphate acyltransferase, partial [Bryobacteraceae bacterium]